MNWIKTKKNFFRVVEGICYLCILGVIVLCICIFVWERDVHWRERGYIADAEILGNFGDFIAGCGGTIIAVVSMYLLFRTLKSQRAATISNNTLMNVQRFNDLFFRLIDLYRELTNDLRIIGNEKDKACKGKDSFDYWRNSVYKKINPTQDFNRINKQIIEDYQNFYDLNRNSLGAYFRVLYRLLELIDTSDISTKEKRDYGKILRAQLYESELFVLFYNSQIEKGEKLGKYLWKYHILKHLPIYETIEFKVLYGNLEEQEKEWMHGANG